MGRMLLLRKESMGAGTFRKQSKAQYRVFSLRSGIIGPTLLPPSLHIAGKAMAATGADLEKHDLYIDLRAMENGIIWPRHNQPPSLQPPFKRQLDDKDVLLMRHLVLVMGWRWGRRS
ncbi:MAG: hypothetical protein Q9173_003266 [Seirophora scorigena]